MPMSVLPISLTYYTGGAVEMSPVELALYGRFDVVRQMMKSAIRRYVNAHRELLAGRVLDYGAGKLGTCPIPQPYRELIGAADYVPWEPGDQAPSGKFDAILCTQVIQNVEDLPTLFENFYQWLRTGGHLVLTYPVAWEEIERECWRLTHHGAWTLCHGVGLDIQQHQSLAEVNLDGALKLVLANGLVARKVSR